MGLFFLISGVVMVLGYGQKKYDNAGGMPCETCCCSSFLACGCCAPTSLVNEHDQDQDLLDQALAVTLQPSNETVPASKAYALADSNETTTAQAEEVEVKPFPSKEFLIKRFARLGPVYYLTSALAIPLWLCKLMFSQTASYHIPSHCIPLRTSVSVRPMSCLLSRRITLHCIAFLALHCISLHHIASYRIISHHIASHTITHRPHSISSHRIASHRIASHRIAFHNASLTLHYISLD